MKLDKGMLKINPSQVQWKPLERSLPLVSLQFIMLGILHRPLESRDEPLMLFFPLRRQVQSLTQPRLALNSSFCFLYLASVGIIVTTPNFLMIFDLLPQTEPYH